MGLAIGGLCCGLAGLVLLLGLGLLLWRRRARPIDGKAADRAGVEAAERLFSKHPPGDDDDS